MAIPEKILRIVDSWTNIYTRMTEPQIAYTSNAIDQTVLKFGIGSEIWRDGADTFHVGAEQFQVDATTGDVTPANNYMGSLTLIDSDGASSLLSFINSDTAYFSTKVGGLDPVDPQDFVTKTYYENNPPSTFNSLQLTTGLADPTYSNGLLFADNTHKTLSYYSDIEGPVLQVGLETWKRVKNNTGSIIADGAVVYVNGEALSVGGNQVSTVALAKADAKATCQGTIGFATHEIGIGAEGWVTLIGAVRGLNTLGVPAGTPINLSATVAGEWTIDEALSPNFQVKLGTISTESATTGSIDAHIEVGDNQASLIRYYNGAFLGERTVTVGSTDGLTVTCQLECPSGPSCYVFFDGEIIEVDTTPALSVNLTAGTTEVPIRNYVYILSSDPTQLVKSTVGWPSVEHARVTDTYVQSAADVLANEVYKNHEWTDHLTSSSQQGHSSDLNFWIRQQHATYLSGFGVTISGTGTGSIGLSNTIGTALQLHEHAFPAFTNPARVLIVNDETANYTPVTNIGITTDTTGASLNTKTFASILWAVVSEEDNQCKWMMNKPNGSYNNADDARNDASGFTNYSIPSSFRGCGVLVHRVVMKLASGIYTVYADDSDDLRGQMPNTTAGGSVGAGAQNLTQVLQTGADAGGLGITNLAGIASTDLITIDSGGDFEAIFDDYQLNIKDTTQTYETDLRAGEINFSRGGGVVKVEATTGGNLAMGNAISTNSATEIVALGGTAFQTVDSLQETTSATVTPSAGWTTVTASPIRISQSPIGYSIASGGMTRTSSTVTYNDIVATYTGVTLTRDVEIHSSVFDGTNYIAGQARIDTSGDIKWRGQTTTNVSAIIINGVLE